MGHPLHLLLIEDSDDDAGLLLRELKRNQFDVTCKRVQTKEDMMLQLETEQWDLIISDYEMPQFSGLKSLEIYKQFNLDIPFIVVSGNIGENVAVELMKAGAHDYVMKDRMARLGPAVVRELREAESRRERKKAENALRELEEKRRQSQKMESIGILAGGIAHDFNNILSIILGHVTLLGITPLSPEQQKRVNTIVTATNRGSSLVRQLLTFARQTTAKYEEVNINKMIDDLIILLRETFPKKIVITSFSSDDLPLTMADATQVNQVLLNMCVNARDAMPNGGNLILSTSVVRSSDLTNGFGEKNNADSYIRVDVIDTGIGMDESTQKRIFEPFFTTKEVGKGTGLGLSVVFGIMESHKGFIRLTSEVGKGTTFSLFFPVTKERDLIHKDYRITEIADIPGGIETILFIEDEDALREFVREVLMTKGYHVFTAIDGEDALKIFDTHKDSIQLIFTDNEMPKLSGCDVIEKVRLKIPNMKVIIASGSIVDLSEGNKNENQLYIEKPYDIAHILESIRNLLDRP